MNVSGEEFAMLDEVVSSIYNRGIKDGMEDSEKRYKQGLNDAWECARKINDMYYQKLNEVFPDSTHDNIFIDYSAQEAMQKIKEYEQQKQDAIDMNDGSIKVGDEVRIKGSDPVKDDCDYGICTRSLPNVNTIYVMRRDGSSGEENKDEWYRTGRHFPQIAEVLKQLRGDKA